MSDNDPNDRPIDSRPYIECDACGQPNPAKRCARCQCAFYCLADCQKKHWRSSHKRRCEPIDQMRSNLLATFGPLDTQSTLEPVNTACGICLEEPIKSPVVLSQCRHAFCFACLKDWQGYRKMDAATKWCPFCRQDIEKSVVDQALETAASLASRAGRLEPHDPRRSEWYERALDELEKVIEVAPLDTTALGFKAQVLTHVRPQEAVVLLQSTLQREEQGSAHREAMLTQLHKARAAINAGDPFTADRIMRDLESKHGKMEEWQGYIGE
jgi:Zinc finger, C3HC4 type (RING finger)/MYND finger